MSSQRKAKTYKLRESYRHQDYVAVISLDAWKESWAWKGHIDFDTGVHSISTNRNFATADQAKEHMRQSAHQCIDNRLGY